MNSNKIICVVVAVIVAAVGVYCGISSINKKAEVNEEQKAEVLKHLSTADAIAVIQQESKLYSAEQTAHKNIVLTTKDIMSVLGYKFTKPWSRSTYVIPIDVTYKVSINLGQITEKDVAVNEKDSSITITLPDPVIELTSCEIRHDEEKIHQQIFASTQSQEFFNKAVSDAEKGIWSEVSVQRKQELLTTAKRNAENTLAGVLLKMGYKKVNITYSSKFDPEKLTIDMSNVG